MKKSRLCKVRSELHIPADLWPEILSRLPVKSLLRFRCVSKSWLSLVDDADFARLHLNNFKNNRDETHLLVVQGRQHNCVVRCSDTFETNSETLVSLGRDKNGWHTEGSWDFVCSFDGLVVLKSVNSSGRFRALKVWNPSIRKFHEIPSLPKIETFPEYSYLLDTDLGLGYDSLAKDYKFVKLLFVNYKTLPSVAIYSVGGGSWKIIKFQGKGSSCPHWGWGRGCSGRSVYFQGSLYFIARDAHNHLVRDLVSFDLSNEVFSFVSMPDGFRGRNELALIDSGCSLAVIDTMSVDRPLWVLESEAMYWTKRCSYPFRFLYLKKNGDILTMRRRIETIKITSETGKNKFVRWEQVTSYSPETDEFKSLEERRDSPYMIRRVCGYVESLILHK